MSRSQQIILKLKLKGILCPCLESASDREARESIAWVQSQSSWRIQWHRPMIGGGQTVQLPSKGGLDSSSSKSSGKVGLTSFMSSLVQTVVSSTIGYSTVDARFSLIENEYGLAMRIVKLSTLRAEQRQQEEGDMAEEEGGDTEKKGKNKRKERVILLQKLSTLEPSGNSNGIIIYGLGESPATTAGSTSPVITKGKELVRFDLLSSSKTDDEMSDLRDELIDRIIILIEWERKRFLLRQSQLSGDENDETTLTQETDEDGEPIHRNIAQRAAHFAKRELEMAHTKRERESRKAKYMAASGGLKYTALAMASRAEIS